MNCKTETICRLCLNTTDCHFDVIDDITKSILQTLSVKIDFSANQEPLVMCKNCADTLQKCFDLVCLCQKTKESKPLLLHFDEGQVIVNDTQFKSCLFCMGPVSQTVCSRSSHLEEDIVSLQESLSECIFELYAIASEEPVLCECCHEALESYMNFARKCVEVEKWYAVNMCKVKEEDYCETKRDFAKVPIKREHFMETNVTLHTDVKLDDYKSESSTVRHDEATFTPTQLFKCDSCNFVTTTEPHLTKHSTIHQNKDKSAPKELFKCESCNFVTTTKRYLKKHSVRHTPDIPLFKCDLCPFTTRHKWYIATHALLHNDSSEYDCPTCSYRTKNPNNFKRHLANHDKSPKYKCDECQFATKHRICLKRHAITHKSSSDVAMFKCESCPYESRFKKNLTTHMLVHKDASEVTMYVCDACTYKTKNKHNLVIHKLIHKSEEEVEIFECQFCSYSSKRKKNLTQHSVVHKGASEVETFECGLCGYVAKRKTNLAQHMVGVHKFGR